MKNLRHSLVFVLILTVMILATSCTSFLPTMQSQTCTVHRDINRDTYCDICKAYVPIPCTDHTDANHDGKCDTNGCTAELEIEHCDENHDGKCDEKLCKKKNLPIEHEDDDNNKKCDVCGAKIDNGCDCEDDNGDGYCDECGEEIYVCDEHTDNDNDGECDECGTEIKEECDEHVDENSDGKCDECDAEVEIEDAACNHTDENFDGKCDLCREAMENSIAFYENGETKFNFVLAAGSPGPHVQIIDKLMDELKDLGITVSKVDDKTNTVSDFEVLFGVCTSRAEEHQLDPHEYGMEGYAVKLVGTKIIVVSGSNETFADAVAAFKETFLGITDSTNRLTTRYISESMNINEVQDNYKVNTITLYDKDIKNYTIAVDKANTTTFTTAKALQDLLYSKTGYWFDIVSLEEADKSIVISMAKKNPEKEGFYANFTDGKIEFIAEYPTIVNNKVIGFFTKAIAGASGTLNFTDKDSFASDVRYVYYKDYGAVGDGVADDSEAIRAAHEYANKGGHKVLASNGATYYIGKLTKTIPIQTDVDWLDATFIIDDRDIAPLDKTKTEDGEVTYRGVNIFTVTSSSKYTAPAEWSKKLAEINANGGIDASTFTSFEFEFGRPLMLYVYNNTHKTYIRYGVNASGGGNQNDMVLVDEHGNLDPSTPFMFDFENISYIIFYPIDDEPITVEGGIFKTSPYLTDTPQSYTSYERGLNCKRSNVTFKNIKHYLENEGDYSYSDHQYKGSSVDYGCPYGGFYGTNKAANVRYENCLFSGHIVYWQVKSTGGAGMGTYDLSPGDSINVTYEGCYQEDDNFFARANANGIEQSRWGVMGSSGCKNVSFIDSKLTRFDAHAGIHNVNIINTTIKSVRVVGSGTFRMENSIVYNTGLISLREDYGGFWHGNFILKNNKLYSGNNSVSIFSNSWYNHYFGYPLAYPTNVIIDGFEVYTADGAILRENPVINIFAAGIYTAADNIMKDYFPVNEKDENGNAVQVTYSDGMPVMIFNENQTPPFEKIVIRNCKQEITIPKNADYPWFSNTIYEINVNTECVEHFSIDGDLKCDDCGAAFTPCTEHADANSDGRCRLCGGDVFVPCDQHMDKDTNGECDTCYQKYHCPAHRDDNKDRYCDVCRATMCYEEHRDTDKDCICDICIEKLPCVDANGDKKCDVCTVATYLKKCSKGCVDVFPFDSVCDVCAFEIPKCTACTDENSDSWCDTCHRNMTTGNAHCYLCSDNDKNGSCDTCGAVIEPLNCKHVDKWIVDGACDFCGINMSAKPDCEHIDETGEENAPDGKCDLCEEDMPATE